MFVGGKAGYKLKLLHSNIVEVDSTVLYSINSSISLCRGWWGLHFSKDFRSFLYQMHFENIKCTG